MIGNITKGSDFGGICAYLLHPNKQAQIIGGNVAGTTPGELEAEFMAFASLNQRVKKVVNHLSLGFAPEDGLVTREMQERIGERIMRELGYGNAQYLIVAHGRNDPGHDTLHDHDHIHIVANAVDLDGKWVDDFQSFRRLEKVLRQIEQMSEQDLLAHIRYQRSLQMEATRQQEAERRQQLTETIKQQEAERKRQSAENLEGFKERIQAIL